MDKAKEILYKEEARAKLISGVNQLSEAVRTTLGPKGRNVAFPQPVGPPIVTHDGVTVAKQVKLKDPFEDLGAQLVLQAASKTNDAAGDGTTTATILAQAIITEGNKHVTAGVNPMTLRRGLQEAVNVVVEDLIRSAIPIKTKEEMQQVATLSSADPEIGEIVADTLSKTGEQGIVTIEESKSMEFEVDYREGMNFDRGYLSPHFILDPKRMEAAIETPYIVIVNETLSSYEKLLPFLERMVKEKAQTFVFIADDITNQALATLVVNKLQGNLNTVAIKSPSFGDRKKDFLQDIAILTGGTVIDSEIGTSLETIKLEELGRADRVITTRDDTTIVGGKGEKKEINKRVQLLKTELKKSDSEYDRGKLEERIAKLSGGVAVIGVGAATEAEMQEKKYRVEDAVGATKAAIEGGVITGGGVSLLNVRKALAELREDDAEGTRIAAKIIYNSLVDPLRQLLLNAGLEPGAIIQRLVDSDQVGYGYDILKEEYCMMSERGLVDPLLVTTAALQNAVSVAITILTTDAVMVPEPVEPPKEK